ncbi:phage tail protein [Pediococcus pentosaceus]|uniref:phage tail protein n=1 Tax=Pediococcus pentosaceus TaxID=1255 RepID=UPI0007624515|nr:phage tail protein [Pediococcus pentosaceus]NEZ68490.1 phage tail protein [Pediococcus pentosaceus]
MATVGLKLVTLALKDENGKIIKGEDKGLSENGLLPVTTQMWGTKTANITNIQAAGTINYGNNVAVFVSTPKGAPQVALDFNKLPFEITQKLVGRTKDANTGAWIESGKHPSVALLIESQSIDRLHRVFYGFGNGTLTQASINNGTDTNAETMATDALTYQALSTPEFNGEMLAMYSDVSTEFKEDKMMEQVFAGYTATTQVTPQTGTTGTTQGA